MTEKKKKKSSFSLDNYVTHDGEQRGNEQAWQEAALSLLKVKKTKKQTKKKLTQVGVRKITLDED